jgi:hypothetical protein
LDNNDPSKTYSLRSLPGTFSVLWLVSLKDTGLQLIDFCLDAGGTGRKLNGGIAIEGSEVPKRVASVGNSPGLSSGSWKSTLPPDPKA